MKNKKSLVNIENNGASTFDVNSFLFTKEGKQMLKELREFYEKYKGVSLND